MRYSELISFEPIETVIELRQADAVDGARRLVRTYVISDRMAEQLRDLVVPNLQFSQPADNKGLFVVGNYGTGKSHLMALLSALAEHEDLAAELAHRDVAKAAEAIGGKFKVIRSEIGSTTQSLRDILCNTLETGLANMGVSYEFKPASEISEHKSSFQQMMAAFQAKYPDKGLLLVVDELLDYLRSRKDQELSLDLSFLREMGEFCKGSRFRFMVGVQESLFDSARFEFVSDTLRRVRARYEQLRIVRTDVAHVVSERLLKKTPKQQGVIREHLVQFGPLYGTLNERLEEFVRLFPVHPNYLETFEELAIAEKREALKTLSKTIRKLLDTDVPADAPGLIAYDSYWKDLKDDASVRSNTDVKAVIDKADTLEGRVTNAFTRPQYKPVALRIVHALAVHRLLGEDIYAPVGATAEELRDNLCLLVPGLPERNAEFLRTLIETVLKDIVKTANGQFISSNPENGQFYLDLKKDIDYDANIDKKAETLDDSTLDSYYFDALRRVILENPDQAPHVAGNRIWEHELEWTDRKSGRNGYLFFGAPNERSTAQPPRDFYLYFIQPFEPPAFTDDKKADEVFFRLKKRDEEFDRLLRSFAAANEVGKTASGSNKKIYTDKAGEYLQKLTKWLMEHAPQAIDVTFQGKTRSLLDVVQGKVPSGSRVAVRDLVNVAGSACLSPSFADQSPDYPTFGVLLLRANREQAAQDALKWIAGSVKSKQATAVLDGLALLDAEKLKPADSKYARQITDLLSQRGSGQVLNRADLIKDKFGVPYWEPSRIEPELLAVVLAALVSAGEIVVSLPGRKIDASDVEQFARLPIADLVAFKHLERPRDLPLPVLTELFDLLGLNAGLLASDATRDEAVRQLQARVQELVGQVVETQSQLGELVFWGRPVLSTQERTTWESSLNDLKGFLEALQPFNTAGKLKNLQHTPATVSARKPALRTLQDARALRTLCQEVGMATAYLASAEAVLPPHHEWVAAARAAQAEWAAKVVDPAQRGTTSFARDLGQALDTLKASYQDAYLRLHADARLGAKEEKQQSRLMADERLKRLRKLMSIEMMPSQQLRDWEASIVSLKGCSALTKTDLAAQPQCPHCQLRPSDVASAVRARDILGTAEERLHAIHDQWSRTLADNLSDPTVVEATALLTDGAMRAAIEAIRTTKTLPDEISSGLVKALQDVLGGLEAVDITAGDLHAALLQGGSPCTLDQLRQRFEEFVDKRTKGRSPNKVRVRLS